MKRLFHRRPAERPEPSPAVTLADIDEMQRRLVGRHNRGEIGFQAFRSELAQLRALRSELAGVEQEEPDASSG